MPQWNMPPQPRDIPGMQPGMQNMPVFGGSPPYMPPHMQGMGAPMMTVEQLEAQMRMHSVHPQGHHQGRPMPPPHHFMQGPPGHYPGMPPQMPIMSVAELEAQFLAQRQQHAPVMVPYPNHPYPQQKPPSPVHQTAQVQASLPRPESRGEEFPPLGAEVSHAKHDRTRMDRPQSGHHQQQQQQQRRGRQVIYSNNRQQGQRDQNYQRRNEYSRIPREQNSVFYQEPASGEFDGLMTTFEKENIAKIQLSQLVTDNPFRDDYYYQMYKLSKDPEAMEKFEKQKWQWKKTLLSQATQPVANKDVPLVTKHMRMQMQKLIEGKKLKQKESTCESILLL